MPNQRQGEVAIFEGNSERIIRDLDALSPPREGFPKFDRVGVDDVPLDAVSGDLLKRLQLAGLSRVL